MKYLTLVLALVFLTVGITEAQVKRQYRNTESNKTVMVIKQDGNAQSDIDILNSQFDLANVSMNDEVMITTEQFELLQQQSTAEQEVTETSTAEVPAKVIAATTATPEITETPEEAPIVEATPVVQTVSKSNTMAQSSTVDANNRTSTASVAKSNSRASSTSSVNRSSFKKKKKSKRVRLKKRKKVRKRKFSSCYSF